jgi:predicted RNA-binding Zn-ribbon protein involved in translation (DUF1610 family)
MPIEFNCHVCGKLLRTADEKAGKTAKCPGCGEKLTVPGSATEPDDEFDADEFGDGDADDYEDEDEFASTSSGGAKRQCPMCGESISRKSTRCEYCGEKVGGGGGRPSRRRSGIARDKVGPPAIGLMVAAGLGIAVNLLGIAFNILGLMGGAQRGAQPIGGAMVGGIGLAINALAIVLGIVIIFGALKMKRLESYGMAMTASIVAMIPCFYPCCLVGIPIGIWALIVLNDSEVKDAFPG